MKRLLTAFLTLTLLFSFALPAFAATGDPIDIAPCPEAPADNTVGQTQTNFNPLCNLGPEGNVVSRVITLAFVIATLIALAFLIYGGIRWILSGGDKAGVEAARNTIVAALIGLVIVFLSYFILRLVFGLFGIELGNNLRIPSLQIFTPTNPNP